MFLVWAKMEVGLGKDRGGLVIDEGCLQGLASSVEAIARRLASQGGSGGCG